MKPLFLRLISALSLTILLLNSVTSGQAQEPQNISATGQAEIYFVPDVVSQFNQLALRPEPLAFGLGSAPDPHIGKHFQGIVRRHGPGTPYMFLSRSGNDVPECINCDDDPGNIYIVKMHTRDTNGERLRSNRLRRGWGIADTLTNLWPTPPDPLDKTVRTIYFNGQNGWPNYGHPGGMQMVGDVLVVPLSHPYQSGVPANLLVFLNVSNPEAPVLLSQFDPLSVSDPSSEFEAGQVAVTPVLNQIGPGARYIMLLAGKNDRDVRLFRSLPTSADGSTDLKSANLSWEFIRNWNRDEVTDTGAATWPCCGSQSYQMFNFIRQENLNGPLFMIGAFNTDSVLSPGGGTDYLDLYRVNVDQYGNPGDHLVTRIERKHVSTNSISDAGDTSHFTGSTGVYVSPSGELIVYGSDHANYGPWELLLSGFPGRKTVRFGEWRHREMVRPNSPTLRPSVEVFGTFEVDEGSTTLLTARGKAPITKAWIQLFEDDGVGLSDDFDGNNWLVVDFQDWDRDDFDNFPELLSSFNDNAGSWRWFAPLGTFLHVNQHSFDDSDFPGRRKTLVGAGLVRAATDLNAVMDDAGQGSMDDMISSVQFFCDTYYNAPIGLAWDLNLDGIFETTGNLPTFSAAELDGPNLIGVPVRAQHPTDTTPLGTSAPATLAVRIRNVAPSISNLDLVDPIGSKVGVDVPAALVNLPYDVKALFTDPGKPDRQTARLNMGDGTIIDSSAFDSFSDAFGGATGQLSQRHRYRAAGTYTITLEVTDDDGGATTITKSVTVVTPAQVVQSIINKIDLLLAATTNRTVTRALRDARESLAGHNNGAANDGALDALESGDLMAALEKISSAIEALQRAEAAGAGDLSELKDLLGFVAESVAQGAHQDALTAVGTPSPGQAMQLEAIRQSIVDGHTRLANREYLAAIQLFKDAVGRALSLL